MQPADMTFRNIVKPHSQAAAYNCPCCGHRTLHERGGDEICKVCFWQDDGQDDHDADEVRGGPNKSLSLDQAQKNFAEYGASLPEFLKHVRPPTDDER
jgi:hypothetical protein